MSKINLGYMNIFVRDFERAFEFYAQTLGLPVNMRHDDFGYASFDTGPASLAISRVDETQAELVGRHTGAGLVVEDLDAVHKSLADKGVKFPMPPQKQPWGGYMSLMEDSEGNILYLDQAGAHD